MLLTLILAAAAQPGAQASIEGTWRSPGGNSIITIAPCGESLCGTVAWASEQAKKDAARATDRLVGTQLLTAVVQDARGRWRGKLFIPDKNRHVTAKLERVNADTLKVSGCAVGRTLCKSTLWTRADGPLPASD